MLVGWNICALRLRVVVPLFLFSRNERGGNGCWYWELNMDEYLLYFFIGLYGLSDAFEQKSFSKMMIVGIFFVIPRGVLLSLLSLIVDGT